MARPVHAADAWSRRRWLAAAVMGGLGSVGCATSPYTTQVLEYGEPDYAAAPAGGRRRLAVVLSGGAARGFAHLGMLRVLEREGLRPDLIVGTSAGAIVGALWASGMAVQTIERLADEVGWAVLFDPDLGRMLLAGVGLGILSGERLERFLRAHLRIPIEQFPIAFAAVAADMETGDIVTLNRGDAARAVRASCSVPGVYAPVRVRGRLLADGQVVSPLPVSVARDLGARHVLALDVVYPPQHSEMSSPVSMLFQSLIVSSWRHVLAERTKADVVITPEIRTSVQLGIDSRSWVADAGERAAMARLPEIRRLRDVAVQDDRGALEQTDQPRRSAGSAVQRSSCPGFEEAT